MSKAYKIYSPKTDKFIHAKNTNKYIWEKVAYSKQEATRFRKKHNLPPDALQIIEYDMVEVGPIE